MRSEVVGLIERRFVALEAGDFSALYASYHPQAPLVEQFPTLDDYLEFVAEALSGLRVLKTVIGQSRQSPDGVEIISSMQFELNGAEQSLFELALLLKTGDGWCYHSAQKLTAEDYHGDFGELDFSHFDQQSPKVRF